MALTDMDFYSGCFGGGYDKNVILPLLKRAEEDIRCVCSDRAEEVFEGGVSVSDKTLFAVKRAACLQAEFLAEREGVSSLSGDVSGGDDGLLGGASAGAQTAVSSVKLGDFSVNFSSSEGNSSGSGSSGNSSQSGGPEAYDVSIGGCARGNLCGEALLILDRQGLLYRGGVMI